MTTTHHARVVQEDTVVSRRSIRATCSCGWYGTIYAPDEPNANNDAWRDGRRHEREARAEEVSA